MTMLRENRLVRFLAALVLVVGFSASLSAYESRFEDCVLHCPEYDCDIAFDNCDDCQEEDDCTISFTNCEAFLCSCEECWIEYN